MQDSDPLGMWECWKAGLTETLNLRHLAGNSERRKKEKEKKRKREKEKKRREKRNELQVSHLRRSLISYSVCSMRCALCTLYSVLSTLNSICTLTWPKVDNSVESGIYSNSL